MGDQGHHGGHPAGRWTSGNLVKFPPREELPAAKELAKPVGPDHDFGMGFQVNPVSLTAEQVEELSRKLSTMRHDINNHLSLIVAASELIKLNPAMAERMSPTLNEQPSKISEALGKFSAEFEKTLGIVRS